MKVKLSQIFLSLTLLFHQETSPWSFLPCLPLAFFSFVRNISYLLSFPLSHSFSIFSALKYIENESNDNDDADDENDDDDNLMLTKLVGRSTGDGSLVRFNASLSPYTHSPHFDDDHQNLENLNLKKENTRHC